MQIPYKFNPLGNSPDGGQLRPIAGERGVFVYLHDDVCNQSGMTVWSRFLQSNNTNRIEVYSGGTAFRTTATYAHINVHEGGCVSQALLNESATLTVSSAGFAGDLSCNTSGYISALPGASIGRTLINSKGVLSVGSGAHLNDIWTAPGGSLYCTEGGCSINGLNLLSGAPVAISGEGNVLDHTVLWEKASVVCSAGTSYRHMTVNSAGTIQVQSGASAVGVILSGGAGLIYGSGAKITNAQYSSGAVLNCNVWGHDTETVFEGTHDSGSFTLSNGTASGLVLGFGNRLAASYYGQVSHVTAQSLGQISLCFGAFAQDCTVSAGGTILVSSGASANRLQNAGSLTGGNDIAVSNLTVSSPGFGSIAQGNAENVSIGSGAYCSFGSSCTIHSGSINGTLYLNNSCTINGLTLGVGGTVSCIQRGVFQNLTVEQGGYCIPGVSCTFSNAVVYGSVYSANTCTANGLTVGSGGFVSYNLNGVFQNLTVESDGILSMASNGTVTSATIDGGLYALMGFKGTHIECLSDGVLSCGNGTGHTLTSISNRGLVQIVSRGTITHMLNQGTLSVGGGSNVLNGISNGGTMYLAGGNDVTFTGTMGGTVYESAGQSALVGMTLGSGGRYVWAGFSTITHITSVPPGAALEIRGSRNSALSVQLDDGAELCLYGASNHISEVLCGTSATINHSGSANSILNVTLGPGGSYLMNGPLACSAISGVIASGAVMECIGSQNVARYFTVAECGTLRLSGPYVRGTFIELKSGGLLEVGGSYTSALSVTVSSGGTLSYGGLGVFGSAINLLGGGHLSAQGSSVTLYVTSHDGAIVDVGDGVKIYYV